jgi:hypothetical protein
VHINSSYKSLERQLPFLEVEGRKRTGSFEVHLLGTGYGHAAGFREGANVTTGIHKRTEIRS